MSLTARLSRLLTNTKDADHLDVNPRPDPAVRDRLLELDRAGYSVDYLIATAAAMRNARTVRTSR